jgi:glutamate-1-semialdehyde 2,1-aminomutase
MPVGAYGGRADVMDVVSPVGPVYQAGTLSGNPLAMACGLATLRTLRELNPYPDLEAATQRLVAGLTSAARDACLSHQAAQCGSMFTLFFAENPVHNLAAAMLCDTARFARYFQEMLERGIYLPCSQFEANFISAAHTAADIDATIAAAREAMSTLSALRR